MFCILALYVKMTADSFTKKFHQFFTMQAENPDRVTGWASCLQLLKLMTCKMCLPFFMNSTSKILDSKMLNMYIFFAWKIQTICSFQQRRWLWDWFRSCIKVSVTFNEVQIVIPTFTKKNYKLAQLQKEPFLLMSFKEVKRTLPYLSIFYFFHPCSTTESHFWRKFYLVHPVLSPFYKCRFHRGWLMRFDQETAHYYVYGQPI